MALSLQDILEKYETSTAEARAENEKRYAEGISLANEAIARYQPGGQFGKGAEAQYQTGKKQALGMGFQQLMDQGLGGTTIGTALPLSYEQNVGTPFRLQLEDMRMQNLTEAEQAKMGWIQAREDAYPDYGMFAQLMAEASQAGSGGTRYGGSPFPSDQPGYSGIMNEYGRSSGGGGSTDYSTLYGSSNFNRPSEPKSQEQAQGQTQSMWNTFGPLQQGATPDWTTPPTMSVGGSPTLADYGKAHQYGSSVMTLGAQQGPATEQQTADYFQSAFGFTGQPELSPFAKLYQAQ